MKVNTPEISWHERDPVYSVDFQPGKRNITRLATVGVDKFVRLWQVVTDKDGKGSVEFLSNLKRHTKSVNVCRFSPNGDVLASAGDDSVIIFWRLSDTQTPVNSIFQEDEEDNKENWVTAKVLRGHLEDIYDLCWSSDAKYMISGSVDNSAILWDLTKDQKLALFNEHKSFVQGVAFDPLNEFVATLSTDRSLRVFNVSSKACVCNVSKMTLPKVADNDLPKEEGKSEVKQKSVRLFHDDTMRSFFRRLCYSPDGEILIVPAGILEIGDKVINSTYLFTRHSLNKPAVYLPSPKTVTICARCSPILYKLRHPQENTDETGDSGNEWEKCKSLFCLPYRIVFAVGTEDSLLLYDTQQQTPFAFVSNIHYHQLSDIAWSHDGKFLVVSSTDGFCTIITFEDGEIGEPYQVENKAVNTDTAETEIKEDKAPQPSPAPSSSSSKSEEVISMDTDSCSSDLKLVLETSNDEGVPAEHASPAKKDVNTCTPKSPISSKENNVITKLETSTKNCDKTISQTNEKLTHPSSTDSSATKKPSANENGENKESKREVPSIKPTTGARRIQLTTLSLNKK